MTPEPVLSEHQIRVFKRDGYVLVKGMYNPDESRTISEWTDELAACPEAPGKAMMYFETSDLDRSRILCRIENFVPFHEGFSQLIQRRRMEQSVAELLGEPVVLFKDKINFKLPGADRFRAHQDVQAGWDKYAPIHITAMVAIDETNEENGSLEIIAGLHRKGMLGKMWAPLTAEETGHVVYRAVHCQPGDAIFFDSYTPHRSHANHSDKARRVLYITYNSASAGDHRERYYVDKRHNYPPDIERDPHQEYAFKV